MKHKTLYTLTVLALSLINVEATTPVSAAPSSTSAATSAAPPRDNTGAGTQQAANAAPVTVVRSRALTRK